MPKGIMEEFSNKVNQKVNLRCQTPACPNIAFLKDGFLKNHVQKYHQFVISWICPESAKSSNICLG